MLDLLNICRLVNNTLRLLCGNFVRINFIYHQDNTCQNEAQFFGESLYLSVLQNVCLELQLYSTAGSIISFISEL